MSEPSEEKRKAAWIAAMVSAQAEVGRVLKDAENAHTRSRYARLEAIDRALRPVLERHGLAVLMEARQEGDAVIMTAEVLHRDGWGRTFSLQAPLDLSGARGGATKSPVQALGSTLTYLRRYLVTMIFNIVTKDDPDDDDGAATVPAQSAITITMRQEISRLLQETRSDLVKFMSYLGISSLDELTPELYKKALAALQAKLAHQRKRAAVTSPPAPSAIEEEVI